MTMMLGGYLLFCLLYLGAPVLAMRSPATVPALRIDNMIPFMPMALWPYLSQFAFLFCAIWYAPGDAQRTRVFYAMLLASVIASVIFIIFPTELPRQMVESAGWKLLYALDVPGNCFPSLHAALAFLSAAVLMRAGRGWAIVAPIWAFVILFSTLATKQHMMIDLFGGLALALASHIVIRRWQAGAA